MDEFVEYSPALAIRSIVDRVIDRQDAEIAIESCYPKYSAHYACNVALVLARKLEIEPLGLGQRLCPDLSADPRFTVSVAANGWLNFRLSDAFLAECLYGLVNLPVVDRTVIKPQQNFSGYTYVQYAYARCHALLRMATKSELVGDWQLLDREGKLLLRSTAELGLAVQCLSIGDEIALCSGKGLTKKLEIKLCRDLATSFLEFYDRCRIFGVNREVSIARIGLISIGQKLIQFLAAKYIDLPKTL